MLVNLFGRALFCTYRQGHRGFFYGPGKGATAAGELTHMRQTSQQILNASGNSGRERRRCLYCILNMRMSLRFVQGEKYAWGITILGDVKPSIQEKPQISGSADRLVW